MAYRSPGTTIIFQDADTTIDSIDAELPLLVIGPLYEVFEKEESDTQFDPLTAANQAFTWPSLRVGSVVDLQGTRSGLIDSQRRTLAPYVPTVYLVDGTSEYTVDDADIAAIDQVGFEILQTARDGLERATPTYYTITVDGETIIYNPEGGLSSVEVGDVTTVDAVTAGTDATVATVSDTKITTVEDISAEALTPTTVGEDEGSTITVTAAVSSTPGRVVYTITGSDFITEVPALAVNDPIVAGVPMTGLTDIAGTINDPGAPFTIINGLSFGVDVTLSEVDGYIVRVENTTNSQHYFTTLVAIDTTAGTMEVADTVALADAEGVTVTIMDSQVGYVEAISSDNLNLTVVVPNTFSGDDQFVDIYTTSASSSFYPVFDVKVDYRALRADLADISYQAGSLNELLSATGHSSVHYKDGLAWAVNVGLNAQPNNRDIYFIPVDTEPTGTTGLPENRDLTTAYTNALESAESVDAYMPILLDRTPAIDSLYQVHIDSMSDDIDKAWRRGFFINDVPLGETESTSGEIAAGRVAGGIAVSATDGNKVIRDAGVDFVTEANVVAGTQVVVTFPSDFAGTYTALGTTTDNDLILDGADWPITNEFAEAGNVAVNTVAGEHVITDDGDVPFATGKFAHVEVGDYVTVDVAATTYRLQVSSVAANGTSLNTVDEVPGTLDFSTGNTVNGSNFSVIRTWGPSNTPAVEYYIRPLTKAQQVTELIDSKSLADRRYTLSLDFAPTMQIDTDDSGNPLKAELDPALSMIAVAAKRSGLRSFDEVTNLTLEGGIESIKYGYNYFKRSQLDSLAEAGFLILTQKTATSEPYIRDMITSSGLSAGLVQFEELVTANADWIGKTLVDTLANPIGAPLNNITPKLLGVRAIQLNALLEKWREEGRLISYQVVKLEQNATNKRQVDIEVVLVLPVAEKEIEITLERSI